MFFNMWCPLQIAVSLTRLFMLTTVSLMMMGVLVMMKIATDKFLPCCELLKKKCPKGFWKRFELLLIFCVPISFLLCQHQQQKQKQHHFQKPKQLSRTRVLCAPKKAKQILLVTTCLPCKPPFIRTKHPKKAIIASLFIAA